jgi:methylglutaconyl-CoA hydratase
MKDISPNSLILKEEHLINDTQKWVSLTLNVPEKYHALSTPLLQDLKNHLLDLMQNTTQQNQLPFNEQIVGVVLKSSPTQKKKIFSAGADLSEMKEGKKEFSQLLLETLKLWRDLPWITYSWISGDAYGGALGFIAASDVVWSYPQAKFCFSEVKLGLIPAMITPFVLTRLSLTHFQYFGLSAKIFSATKAQEIGFVDDFLEETDLQSFQKFKDFQRQVCPYAQISFKKFLKEITSAKSEEERDHLSLNTINKLREMPTTKKRISELLNRQ